MLLHSHKISLKSFDHEAPTERFEGKRREGKGMKDTQGEDMSSQKLLPQ